MGEGGIEVEREVVYALGVTEYRSLEITKKMLVFLKKITRRRFFSCQRDSVSHLYHF